MKRILPVAAIILSLSGEGIGCRTSDLIEAWNAMGGGTPPVIAGRPATQHDWTTPDGRFHIHYDLTGNNAVYHPDEDIDPIDGIPDYVNRTADFLSLAYDSIVVAIGFDPPPFDGSEGGDSLYDIYLTDIPGLTSPENPSNQYPGRPAFTSYIQLGHDLRTPRYPNDPYPFLKASAPHEYFHAVEFAYRAYSTDLTGWWFESCANWAEEKVFDDLNDVYYYLPAYLDYPHRSLYQTAGFFIYGAWLLPEFLEERYDPALIRECWEKFSGFDFAVTAVEFALSERGTSFNYEYILHVAWNYFTGPNFQEGFYAEADSFGATVFTARTHYDYPVEWIGEPYPLENLASSYIVFRRNGYGKGTLRIEYYNPTDDRQNVCLAVVRPGAPAQISIHEIDNGVPSTFIINEFTPNMKVVMMPIWPYEDGNRQQVTSYQYRAAIDSLTSIAASGEDPIFDYKLIGAYPNPFNGALSISFEASEARQYQFLVYDIAGRLIDKETKESNIGLNSFLWSPSANVSSGVLFYVIDFQSRKISGKMSLLK